MSGQTTDTTTLRGKARRDGVTMTLALTESEHDALTFGLRLAVETCRQEAAAEDAESGAADPHERTWQQWERKIAAMLRRAESLT